MMTLWVALAGGATAGRLGSGTEASPPACMTACPCNCFVTCDQNRESELEAYAVGLVHVIYKAVALPRILVSALKPLVPNHALQRWVPNCPRCLHVGRGPTVRQVSINTQPRGHVQVEAPSNSSGTTRSVDTSGTRRHGIKQKNRLGSRSA